MTWQALWRRMMLRNLKMYVGYLLTAAFAVMMFYLFQSLGMSLSGEFLTYRRGNFLLGVLYVTQGVIYVFAVFFVFYFHRLLIQAESQALGLLATFGMARSARRRLVMLESGFLGALALFFGLLAGIVFEPLFMLASSVLLRLPERVPYAFHLAALLRTLVFFIALFAVEGWMAARWATRRWPKQLFAAGHAVETVRRPSWGKGLLGFGLLGAAYGLAAVVHPELFRRADAAGMMTFGSPTFLLWFGLMGVMLVLAMAGSFFVLAEGLRLWVRRRRSGRGMGAATLLTRARLSAALRSHAGSGTAIATLLAVVLAATGMLASIQMMMLLTTVYESPIVVQMAAEEGDEAAHGALDRVETRFREALEAAGYDLRPTVPLRLLTGTVPLDGWTTADEMDRVAGRFIYGIDVIGRSDYEALTSAIEQTVPLLNGKYPKVPALGPGEAFAVRTFTDPKGFENLPQTAWPKQTGEYTVRWIQAQDVIDREMGGDKAFDLESVPSMKVRLIGAAPTPARLMNLSRFWIPSATVFVVSDETFEAMAAQADRPGVRFEGRALFYPRWQGSHPLINRLVAEVDPPGGSVRAGEIDVTTLPDGYAERYRYAGSILFAMALVSLLFALASGATIYFKVRERARSDARQISTLRRLGANRGTVFRAMRREMAVYLFAPLALALLHAGFALTDWRALLILTGLDQYREAGPIVWKAYAAVAAVMLFLYACFGWAVSAGYARSLWRKGWERS
ncbi:MAG: ABC transporter permease [Hydrogenibacillus sp.]|nr:ABC transporter permease [Hydrogenibacillus sp.]